MEQEAGNRLREQELSGAEKRKKGTGTWWKVLLAVVLTLAVCVGGLLLLLGKNGRALLEGYFLARYAFVEADADLDDATDQALDALVNGLGDRWSYTGTRRTIRLSSPAGPTTTSGSALRSIYKSGRRACWFRR